MADTLVISDDGDEPTGYRFSWGLAFAGALAATAITFFLLTLGSGIGLLLVNPVTHSGPSAPVFLTGGAIYFLAAQAFGFAVGGHLAGRLLGPLVETQMQEDFRAGAHGLTIWALTVVSSVLLVAFAGVASSSHFAALYGAAATPTTQAATPTNYLVDKLYRPTGGAAPEVARAEAARILSAAGAANGETLAPDDRGRLITLVTRNSGISRDDAAGRIDAMQADVRAKTREAADTARKLASYASLWIAFSLLFGLIVSISAAIYARAEDNRENAEAARPAVTY